MTMISSIFRVWLRTLSIARPMYLPQLYAGITALTLISLILKWRPPLLRHQQVQDVFAGYVEKKHPQQRQAGVGNCLLDPHTYG